MRNILNLSWSNNKQSVSRTEIYFNLCLYLSDFEISTESKLNLCIPAFYLYDFEGGKGGGDINFTQKLDSCSSNMKIEKAVHFHSYYTMNVSLFYKLSFKHHTLVTSSFQYIG